MRKIFLSITSGVFLFCVSLVLSLIFTPYFLKHITRAEYGMYDMLSNVVVWFGLLRAGQNGGFRYQLSFSLHKKKYVSMLYSTLLIYYSILSVVFLGIGLLCYESLIKWIGLNINYSQELYPVYLLLLINLSITGIVFLFTNILAVYNREYTVNLIRVGLLVVQTLFTVFLIYFDYALLALAIPLVVCNFLFLIVCIFLVNRTFFKPDFSIDFFSFRVLKKSLTVGKWFLMGFLAQLFIKHTDVLLIGKIADLTSVTRFLISAKLYLIATGIGLLVVRIISTYLIKLYRNDKLQYNYWTALYLKLAIGITVMMGAFIVAGNEYFLTVWIGKGFFIGKQINILLCAVFFMNIVNAVLRSVVIVNVDAKKVKVNELIEGVINLVLSIGLGIIWGIKGIVLATVIASLLIMLTSLIQKTRTVIGKGNTFHWFQQLSLLALFCLLIVGCLIFFNSFLFSVTNYFYFALSITLLFALFYYKDIKAILVKKIIGIVAQP